MSALTLLSDLRARGVTVEASGDHLRFWPKERVTADDRSALAENKAELLALLAPIALPSPNHCPRCLKQGVASTGREGQNGSHPGQHRAFHCDVVVDHVWLVWRSGKVES